MKKSLAPINTTFIANAVALANSVNANTQTPWLAEYRQAQLALLEQETFPHTTHPSVTVAEHFKYNRLTAFDNDGNNANDFNQIASTDTNIDSNALAFPSLTNDAQIEQIVFVNGQLITDLSATVHAITAFADANHTQQARILDTLTQQDISKNPFILQNASMTNHGVFIEITENSPKSLIEVVSLTTATAENKNSAMQVVIDISDRCQGTVITRAINASESDNTAMTSNRIIANIGDSSTFNHYHLPLENKQSLHFGSVCYNLASHANLNAFHAITGGVLKKVDVICNHNGQHATAHINGLYVATDNEQVDYHTEVNHPLPHGTTNENFRGIVNGKAEAVFNGRIHIFEKAQKTLAELSNKNLLLSDDAILHTKPELEIYADDVVCAHGATVSRLQDNAINYLRARGISKTQAEKMLSYAFFDELLGELEIEAIADYIRPIVFEKFQ